MKSNNTKRNVLELIAFALYVMALVLIFATSIFKTSYWGGLFFAVIFFCFGAVFGRASRFASLSIRKRSLLIIWIGYVLLKIGEDYFGRLSKSHMYLLLVTMLPCSFGYAVGASETKRLCHT